MGTNIDPFLRTKYVIGKEALEKLGRCHVAIFGLGGVGGAAAEALARCGIGKITIIDYDVVDITNINRQIIALHSTVGMKKTQVMSKRILDINPNIILNSIQEKYEPLSSLSFFKNRYDFVIDAIDMVTSKLHLIEYCLKNDIPIICSMGMGNKTHPELITITDLSKTHMCPLSRVLRRELKNRGIHHLPVVFSPEKPSVYSSEDKLERQPPGSISFVPPVAGYILASYVIEKLIYTT